MLKQCETRLFYNAEEQLKTENWKKENWPSPKQVSPLVGKVFIAGKKY